MALKKKVVRFVSVDLELTYDDLVTNDPMGNDQLAFLAGQPGIRSVPSRDGKGGELIVPDYRDGIFDPPFKILDYRLC